MGGFIATLIGVICKACVDALTKGDTGGNAEFVSAMFTGVAVILTLIGVLVTVIPAKPGKKKLMVLGIHAAIWVIGYFLLGILIPIVIGGVLLVVVLTFLGFHPLGKLMEVVSGASDQGDVFEFQQPVEQQPAEPEKVEVWRRTENGGREDLRVNSSGDMYYDPDDGEWHKIQK